MRIRLSGILSLGVAGIAGFCLFHTSQSVQQSEHQLRALDTRLMKERESVRVLEAEWDYLNRPDRLEQLAREHLKMQPVDPALMVRDGDALPDHAVPVIPGHKPDPALRRAAVSPGETESSSSPVPPAVSPQSVAADPVPPSPPSSDRFDSLINRLTKAEPAAGDGGGE